MFFLIATSEITNIKDKGRPLWVQNKYGNNYEEIEGKYIVF